jgi:predicted nucleotidyltransferase
MASLSKERVEALAKALLEEPRVLATWLLGSASRGELRPGSDVDIAVMADGPDLGPSELCALAARLSLAAGREADVGSLTGRNLVYAREALMGGRLLVTKDPARSGNRA